MFRRFEQKKKRKKYSVLVAFVASATNLGLGIRKLPNAPASEFTSTTTATLTRTRATMWQHVPSVHICTVHDMRWLGTHSIRSYEDADTFFTKRFSFRGALPEKRERDDTRR